MKLDPRGLEAAIAAVADSEGWNMDDMPITIQTATSAITAYLAATGETHVLVAREPTEAMIKAGMDDLGWWVEPYKAPRESGVPVDNDISAEDAAYINSQQIEVVASAFRAMLAAAKEGE